MVDIGSELMGDGGLGASTEKLAFSLEAGEFGLEFGGEGGERLECGVKILVGECMRAEWIAKETKTGSDFGGGVPRIGAEKSFSAVKMGLITGGEVGIGGDISDGGEEVSFSKSDFNAEGTTEFCEFFEEEGEIGVGERNRSIVNDGGSVGL